MGAMCGPVQMDFRQIPLIQLTADDFRGMYFLFRVDKKPRNGRIGTRQINPENLNEIQSIAKQFEFFETLLPAGKKTQLKLMKSSHMT